MRTLSSCCSRQAVMAMSIAWSMSTTRILSLIEQRWFDPLVLGLILLNVAFMCFTSPVADPTEASLTGYVTAATPVVEVRFTPRKVSHSHRAIPRPSQGAELVKKSDLNARFVFVAPPSYDELEKRLRGRGTETEEKLQVRLKNARGEMEYMDRPGFFDAVIVNADLDRAYSELKFALLLGPPPPPK